MSTMKDTAKLLALKAEITLAIQENQLAEKMDILRLKAGDINANLDELIQEVQNENQETASIQKTIAPKKKLIRWVSVGVVVLEWILAFSIAGKLSFWGLILLLMINIVTVLALVFGFAIAYRIKK